MSATPECPPEARSWFEAASARPMIPAAERRRGPTLDRGEVRRLIPHRDPFLFVDRITCVDRDGSTIVCRYDLGSAAALVAGHFPSRPVWPGVLQIEAIGQAGLCLAALLHGAGTNEGARGLALTHVLGARFVRPVTPAGDLEVVSRMLPDGLFTIFVGQCLQRDAVCCVAAVRGVNQEAQT